MKLEANKTYVFKDDAARGEYLLMGGNNKKLIDLYYNKGFRIEVVNPVGTGKVFCGDWVICENETHLFKEKESKPFDISEYEFSDESVSMDSSGGIEVEYESFQGHQDGWSTEYAYAKLNKQDAEAIAKHFKLI